MSTRPFVVGLVRFYLVPKAYGFVDAPGYEGGIYISRAALEKSQAAGFNGPPVSGVRVGLANVFRKPYGGWRVGGLVQQDCYWDAVVVRKVGGDSGVYCTLVTELADAPHIRVARQIWQRAVAQCPKEGDLLDVVLRPGPDGKRRAIGCRPTGWSV